MSAWGSHLDTFLKHGLPSLMTYGNLPALSEKYDIGINIHTNQAGVNVLSKVNIPLMIYTDVTDEDKYRQLGRHQHKDLRQAKDIGADYHLLMPDFIYSENCFAGVMKAVERGHKAIARLVVSTEQESIIPLLKLNMSATYLATISLLHMHPGIKHWLATKGGFPNTHVVAWEGQDTLRMHSPHCSPVYIANEVIKIDDSNTPLDAILDKVIDGDIYLPNQGDGIVIIEMSPKESRKEDMIRVDITEFIRILWCDMKGSNEQLQIFGKQTADAIDRSMLGDRPYWNDVEISEQKSMIVNAIRRL